MAEEQDIIQANRGSFFKDGLHLQMLSIVIIGLSLFVTFLTIGRAYLVRNNQIYFAADNSGSVFDKIPLDSPIGLTRSDVSYWSAQTIARVFTFDYINFYKTFEENSGVFTMKGWNSFKKVLVERDLVRPVVNQRVVLTASPSDVPRFGFTGVSNGRYVWQMQVPLKLQFNGSTNFARTSNLVLVVQVVRSKVNDLTPYGLSIDDIQVLSFRT
ncbi:MAG: hypothetical protein CMF41_06300 [Legionellales bacterium]|nr:hypothetical protein [Legionellales bacterium]OUX64195.1 MAG: hypothetical protein CBE41_03845 [Gammaproteobacteria bacterium TMED281]|tara:strand:+ start:694 stop:1332 length:639 start_codon:yes stop_codon:yes gene_type:complete